MEHKKDKRTENLTMRDIRVGDWVQPSCHDIDIIRRAHTRLFRWIRKGKKNGIL